MSKIYKYKWHSILWSADLWFSETRNLTITETCLYDELTNREWQLQRMNRLLNQYEINDMKRFGKFKDTKFDKAFQKLLSRNLVIERWDQHGQIFYSTSMAEHGRNQIVSRTKKSNTEEINSEIKLDSEVNTLPITNKINQLSVDCANNNINNVTKLTNKLEPSDIEELHKKYPKEDVERFLRIRKSAKERFGNREK